MKKARTGYVSDRVQSSNKKFVITLIAAILFGALAMIFGYMALNSSQVSQAQINKVVLPYRKQLNQKQQQLDDLKATNEGLKQQIKTKQDKVTTDDDQQAPLDFILKNYNETSKQFVSQIIGPHTAAQIRKNLAGIATKDVINKVAPVDVKNEKYDSKIPQSKIEIKDVESYIDVSTLTEKGAKVYAIAHYTIDDTSMTTRINLNLQNQHNKLEVIDANYDVVKSNNN